MSVKPELEIELTADGSHTLFVPSLNEHYHSVNGAVQESTHVFIETGLQHCPKDEIRIFEVGFGTGLNAYLTLLYSMRLGKVVHYTAIEAYPLEFSVIQSLNYPQKFPDIQQELFHRLHNVSWNRNHQVTSEFSLRKTETNLLDFDYSLLKEKVDLIYFDAFAPDKQPEMWTQDIFDNLYNITHDEGILVTYCAKGIVRRMMQKAGYYVERLPGPPGKREMLRARK